MFSFFSTTLCYQHTNCVCYGNGMIGSIDSFLFIKLGIFHYQHTKKQLDKMDVNMNNFFTHLTLCLYNYSFLAFFLIRYRIYVRSIIIIARTFLHSLIHCVSQIDVPYQLIECEDKSINYALRRKDEKKFLLKYHFNVSHCLSTLWNS